MRIKNFAVKSVGKRSVYAIDSFKDFIKLEEKGNKSPTPQKKMNLSSKLVTRAIMPAKPKNDYPIFKLKKQRYGDGVGFIAKPNNIIPGIIKKPSDS